MRKTEVLVFHGTARAIRLIISLLDGRNENISEYSPRIFRKITFHEISVKSFSQGFLLIFKLSENSQRISRKLLLTSYLKSIFPSFITFRSFPRFLGPFWSACVFSFVQQLNPTMISQSNCEKVGQDEWSCNNPKYELFRHWHIFSLHQQYFHFRT